MVVTAAPVLGPAAALVTGRVQLLVVVPSPFVSLTVVVNAAPVLGSVAALVIAKIHLLVLVPLPSMPFLRPSVASASPYLSDYFMQSL